VVLVDTSAWIIDLRHAGFLKEHVMPEEVATCLPVIQEVLQGIRLGTLYNKAREAFLAMRLLESPMPFDIFEEAAQIYRTGRSIGFTIRSPLDCLIAACAIRNDVPVLHSDRDFNTIARFTRLQSRYVAL
jgi:hypothetical protein